jgi:hypothetical protein
MGGECCDAGVKTAMQQDYDRFLILQHRSISISAARAFDWWVQKLFPLRKMRKIAAVWPHCGPNN